MLAVLPRRNGLSLFLQRERPLQLGPAISVFKLSDEVLVRHFLLNDSGKEV